MKEIPLTQGMVAKVDDEWYEYLMQWKWQYDRPKLSNTGYAVRKEGWPHRKRVYMHRVVASTPDGTDVDHIDFDGCNNRARNLRNATCAENQHHSQMHNDNTSGYKRVRKSGNSWRADITVDGKQIYLGSYKTKEEAARAYDHAAHEYFGKYARTNFGDGKADPT